MFCLVLLLFTSCISSDAEKGSNENSLEKQIEQLPVVSDTLILTDATADGMPTAAPYQKKLTPKDSAFIAMGKQGMGEEIVVPENTWLALVNSENDSKKELNVWKSLGIQMANFNKKEPDIDKQKEAVSVFLMCSYSTESRAFEQLEFNHLSKDEVKQLIQMYTDGQERK